MKRSLRFAGVAAFAAALALPETPHAATPAGSYTAAQAASGAKLYLQDCSRCHGTQLEGVSGPALKGPAMKGSQRIADIYGFVIQQMPAGAPGSLSAPAYAAIMAFILRENGHPAGNVALTAATAKKLTAKI